MKLYHGTSPEIAKTALEHGLEPREAHGKPTNWEHTIPSHPGAVYLTEVYGGYFAAQASAGKDWGLVEVDTTLLDEQDFRPDEDFLGSVSMDEKAKLSLDIQKALAGKTLNERTTWFRDHLDNYAHLWKASLKYLGNVAHIGKIPAKAVTRVSVYDSQSNPYMTMAILDPSICPMNFQIMNGKYRALTRWLFKEGITPEEFMGGREILNATLEFSKYGAESNADLLANLNKQLNDQKGIQVYARSVASKVGRRR